MSLKAEIETWAAALELYDAQSFDEALAKFEDIADSSKILFNIGLIYATLGEHEVAVENFRAATNLDQYLAVAYFQCGVSNFLLGMYEEATKDFEDALLYLRGNLTIDYAQLGLKFRLYSCEVLFNKGLSLIYQGAEADGMTDMEEARKEKQTAEHGVIDEALADRGDGYTVFSIPVGVLYRPASSKVKNLASKNYLGQAKLVAATDASETFVGFTGSARAAARNASDLPTSAGPSVEPGAPGIQRRGTTAARIEGTREAASAVNDLRRRPSDNTAAMTPRLGRSATAASAARPMPKLASMPERQESDDEANRNSQGEPYGDLIDSYSETGRARAPASDWNRSNRTASPIQLNRTASPIQFSRTASPIQPFGINARARGPPARRPTLNGSAYDDPGYASSGGPPMRRPTLNGSSYDDTGYGSGADYPETVMSYASMTKIRVKLHHDSDTRGMAVDPEMQLADFMAKVTKKFQLEAGRVSMKYKDEEGSMVSILDEDDWESAVDTARSYARGRPEGKVEIWVEEI